MQRIEVGAWLLPLTILAASAWGCGKGAGTRAAAMGAGGSGPGGASASTTSSGAGGANAGGAGGADAGTPGWTYGKIGGGGFITGGQVAKDGTKFFRTDTSGGYLYDDTTGHLSQIVPRHLPVGTNAFLDGTGCFEAMIAWNDSKTLFAAYGRALYRSTDGGASFTLSKAGFTFDSNSGGLRTYERHGQIDPQNASHVLFGDQVGLYRSTDGGATWSLASGLPASGALNGDTAGWSGVAFNPLSPLASGFSSEAIVSTGGKFFRTTDGGASFGDISNGGPGDEPVTAEFDGKGRYFVAVAKGGLWRYGSGAWKKLSTPNDQGFFSFFLDPTNDQHVVLVGRSNFAFSQSMDGGDSWDPNVNWAKDDQTSVDEIPWHSTNPHYYRANVLVDVTRKVIWTPGGNQGLASIPLSALSGSPPYTCQMHGIGVENMCINTMVAPTGSKTLHAVVWDEWYAQLDRNNVVYPSVVNPMKGGISPSWGLDGSKETPTMLARWLDGSIGGGAPFALSGVSTDDGATWMPFPTLPAGTTGEDDWGEGGELAYSGKDNIIIVSSQTGAPTKKGQPRMPYYTLDRGATWKPVSLPTAWTASNVALVHQAYYLNRQIVVADATQLARFYFLVVANDASFAGVYRTDDGGITWTRTSPIPDAHGPSLWGWNAHIKSPVTGHLWMTAGEEGNGSPAGVGKLWRSIDGGVTFTALPDVLEPNNIAFGAPAKNGDGYPVLFMSGYYQGQPGMWMTANADAATPTWISLGPAPNDQYASVGYMEGDPDVPGRVWVATGCAGVQFGEFGSLLP